YYHTDSSSGLSTFRGAGQEHSRMEVLVNRMNQVSTILSFDNGRNTQGALKALSLLFPNFFASILIQRHQRFVFDRSSNNDEILIENGAGRGVPASAI
ncbi:MAG: hypothetical protein P1U82_27680, partial [Verrucomicrobiales bacterium]|nr:hypothetical protein [Verrucomicrobiales bacterium]